MQGLPCNKRCVVRDKKKQLVGSVGERTKPLDGLLGTPMSPEMILA
jgi:hypothetical protein